MSELHPKGTPDGLASLVSRKENPDIQYIKMQITITTTTSAHSVPTTLNFSAPIAGDNFILPKHTRILTAQKNRAQPTFAYKCTRYDYIKQCR